MTGWIFPGQGAQHVGMGQELAQQDADIQALFDQADEVLGRKISTICFDGPEDELKQTQNAQTGIFLVSAAWLIKLKKAGLSPSVLAGHSLGELSAYYAAGVFDLKTALDVIRFRGDAMAKAYPSDDSAMAAVMSVEVGAIAEAVANHQDKNVVIANYNCPTQIVISGTKAGVQAVSDDLKAGGAKRIIPLNVSGAFHSPLMAKAADEFAGFLADQTFQDATTPIILNRTAQAETKADALKANLSEQVKSSVRWTESIQTMAKTVDAVIEVGPGRVLSGLVKKIDRELSISTAETTLSVEETSS